MITGWDGQIGCATDKTAVGGDDYMGMRPAEIVSLSRDNLAGHDDDQIIELLIAASVDVVLKAHRRALEKLSRRPLAEQEAAVATWGAKHAWRDCAPPCIAKLADIVAEFDRRDQEAASEDVSLEEIEVAPFDAELVGAEGVNLTVSDRSEQ